MVSHGGLLKEIHLHLASDWGVAFPSGFRAIPPNTGITEVEVAWSEGKRRPEVTCEVMHDKKHLEGLDKDLDFNDGLAR